MSLVITLYVREGIVMAADSRLSLTVTSASALGQPVQQLGVGQSDAAAKLFLAPGNIGISTYGAADIAGVPISGYIESFIESSLSSSSVAVDQVPSLLLAHFQAMPIVPATQFHVAGYKASNGQLDQHVWQVNIQAGSVTQLNPPGQQGATWGGEADILARLIQQLGTLDANGNFQGLPTFKIPWQFFTLQDAIDFSVYAIRTTIDTLRFQPRAKTVGGPIDVLVIKPTEAVWVQRKSLHVS